MPNVKQEQIDIFVKLMIADLVRNLFMAASAPYADFPLPKNIQHVSEVAVAVNKVTGEKEGLIFKVELKFDPERSLIAIPDKKQ